MKGLRRRADSSSPRNPQPRNNQRRHDPRPDPATIRQRTRSSGGPINPNGLGL